MSARHTLNSKVIATDEQDRYGIGRALALAKVAAMAGEVPIGAILMQDNRILGEGWNQPIRTHDPTAHAEIMALRSAAMTVGNYRLVDTTLYVTLEPCPMCAGAIIQARVARVVFGAIDPRSGAAGSVFNILQCSALNHRAEVRGEVLAAECSSLLRDFFHSRRLKAI